MPCPGVSAVFAVAARAEGSDEGERHRSDSHGTQRSTRDDRG